MNTKRLSNLATVLRDAQQQTAFVETFSFELWGFSRDEEQLPYELDEAWPEYHEDEHGVVREGDVDREVKAEYILDAITLVPHNCGAPACALGHYALRTDLQDYFILNDEGQLEFTKTPNDLPSYVAGVTDKRIAEHFGITSSEAKALFSTRGCGGAKTPGEAADYIEHFIKKRS